MQPKKDSRKERKRELTIQPENQKQNSSSKSSPINNNIECNKLNYATEIIRPNYMLPTGNSLHL